MGLDSAHNHGIGVGVNREQEGALPVVISENEYGVSWGATASVAVGVQGKSGFQNTVRWGAVTSMNMDLDNHQPADPRSIHSIFLTRGEGPRGEGCRKAEEQCELTDFVSSNLSVGRGMVLR